MKYQEKTKHALSGFSLAPVRVFLLGLGVTVGLWTVWFSLHLPGLNLPPAVMGPAVLIVWVVLATLGARMVRPGLGGAILAGLVTAAISLMALGSVLVEQPDPAAYTEGQAALRPAAVLLAGGFLIAGGIIGAMGAFFGKVTKSQVLLPTIGIDPWPARLAWVVMVSYIPLILLGGLVTSSESGMAVRGWPDTFGANMFLYPVSLMSQPRIFLEHSHRLFGSLAGLATLLLWLVVILGPETRKKFGIWTTALLLAVILQGILGGQRVVLNSPVLAALHGAFGQVVLAYAAVLALWMSPSYRGLQLLEGEIATRSVRVFTTGALHISIVQLVLGAMYRHLRRGESPGSFHILLTHMVFAFGVVIFAVLAGSVLLRFTREHRDLLPSVAGRIRATG
ncbi:hypothetical protein MNBD_PLANCTO03-2355, partial [hydrothermal vent metagenome]